MQGCKLEHYLVITVGAVLPFLDRVKCVPIITRGVKLVEREGRRGGDSRCIMLYWCLHDTFTHCQCGCWESRGATHHYSILVGCL